MLVFILIASGLLVLAMIFAAIQISVGKRRPDRNSGPYLMGNASLIRRAAGGLPNAASGQDSNRRWKDAA